MEIGIKKIAYLSIILGITIICFYYKLYIGAGIGAIIGLSCGPVGIIAGEIIGATIEFLLKYYF